MFSEVDNFRRIAREGMEQVYFIPRLMQAIPVNSFIDNRFLGGKFGLRTCEITSFGDYVGIKVVQSTCYCHCAIAFPSTDNVGTEWELTGVLGNRSSKGFHANINEGLKKSRWAS